MRLALLLAIVALGGCDQQATPRAKQAEIVDERVELLFDPSMARGGYDVDLSELAPIQVQTLLTGDHEAMRHAKMELANAGARGVEAVGRLIERYRADPAGVDYLRNAADVLALSSQPSAAPLLWSLLEQPSESLRIQVLRGLLVHPRPESYDPVLQALASAPPGYQAEICAALGKLDLPRAQQFWFSWLEHGDNPHLWPQILPMLGGVRDPQSIVRAKHLLERQDLDTQTRIWLCAAAAGPTDARGDEAALAELRKARESKNPTERDLAVRALSAAERFDELSWTLSHDELASIRTLVVRGAEAAAERGSARRLLELAANDPDPDLRVQALTALANLGVGEALDEAVQWLARPLLAEVEAGISILRKRMDSDPALALRVWNELNPRLDSIELRTPVERAMLLKILGQIPCREATRRLIAYALASREDLESMRARRYILRQSVNAGAVAQDELFQLWRTSEDKLLRMDAIEAFSALGGAHSRELLIDVLDDPRATPVEVVYVADRLVRIGPASEVAWQLKRKSLRMEEPRAREALQGILWRWYPRPQK